MTRDFDAEIKTAEEALQGIFSEMNETQEAFINAAVTFLKPFWFQQTEFIAKSESEVTKSLGKERLTELKEKVKELEGNTEHVVSLRIGENKLWWHRDRTRGYRSSSTRNYDYEPPSSIDHALRFAAGELAKILEGYGYITQPAMRSNMWRAFNKQKGPSPQNYNEPFYPKEWKWSKDMTTTMNKYEALLQKALAQEEEIRKIKSAKSQSEAEDLWNQA